MELIDITLHYYHGNDTVIVSTRVGVIHRAPLPDDCLFHHPERKANLEQWVTSNSELMARLRFCCDNYRHSKGEALFPNNIQPRVTFLNLLSWGPSFIGSEKPMIDDLGNLYRGTYRDTSHKQQSTPPQRKRRMGRIPPPPVVVAPPPPVSVVGQPKLPRCLHCFRYYSPRTTTQIYCSPECYRIHKAANEFYNRVRYSNERTWLCDCGMANLWVDKDCLICASRREDSWDEADPEKHIVITSIKNEIWKPRH
jgi:hypothetical protein